MKRAHPEHQIQAAIVELWKLRGRRDLDLFAVPNGEYRNPATAKRLKAMGVLPGVADLGITLPQGRMGWLEIKSAKGRLTPEQQLFADRVRRIGHEWAEIRDVKDAAIVLAMWGALRGNREGSE